MAGNIKGITIELNGDTTKLDKALRNVNKETKDVQKKLQEVERALKMDPGNTELINVFKTNAARYRYSLSW